ncbi:protein-methionine-sulfoxide reductase heme-binding subunit MsrQ [Ferrimonas lipolytica]|uniref:Protein-methionine-sulfoxide reductase heme-binding subunit MsrQ n=1 Tax=Ferrimonas lipolytica TaxID=2724191 RepID=A0A6H1UCI0_9GAMM|nr:protein-methionine-sulfoxide reductase heme-binding subunit MsrQ [Ferrimonas lipolytica]QIZ76063.1 protein-methionine-sulfoxide reductase heme-binding subunit MsrQ [Ferrimonas lipolytica]
MVLTKHKVWLTKSALHIGCALPLIWLYIQIELDNLGGDPVQYIIHFLGMGVLHTLVLTLLISPLAKRFKVGWLLRSRRAIGLWSFAYLVLHIFSFLAFDLLFDWSLLLSEIIKRPYITVGMIASIIMLALALTSPQLIQRKMGRRWQLLHKLVYLVAILGPIHFWWSVKSGNVEPAIYLLIFMALLWWRRPVKQISRRSGLASTK